MSDGRTQQRHRRRHPAGVALRGLSQSSRSRPRPSRREGGEEADMCTQLMENTVKMRASNIGKSPLELRKEKFSCATSLRAALNHVARPMFQHQMYQHYTTLENLLNKIEKGEWWLSCCTSDRLNDQKETVKYGSLKIARTLYQTCFCHGAAESVAMWGLYQCSKPCAVRISLTRNSLRKWIRILGAEVGKRKQFERVLFRDLVYLAVSDPDRGDEKYEIPRADCVSWESVVAKGVRDLQEEIAEDWATGLVKDSEWRHERESRLLVKIRKNEGRGIRVSIPNAVLEDMRFTFSPWLTPNMEAMAEKLIMTALAKRLRKQPKELKQRFRRSVLSGGLRLGDGRVPCAFCDTCKLFGRNECHV